MADGQVPVEGRQRAVVEDVGDEAHVLDDVMSSPSLTAMPGRLLARGAGGRKAEVGEVGDRLAGGVDAEDPAGLLRRSSSSSRRHRSHDGTGSPMRPRARSAVPDRQLVLGGQAAGARQAAVGQRDVDEALDDQAVAAGAAERR